MQGADMTSDVFQMPAETLAISFAELKPVKGVPKSKAENLTGINYKSGKTLFRKFIKENRKVDVGADLANSISHVRFGGFLQDPLTLLLQGDPARLQSVRNAWIHCRLKAPAGYCIDFVGDVTRIAARPLVKGNLVSLEEAICAAIQNIVSVGKIATQSAIANELTRTAPDMHFPNRQLIHETLGRLIRGRKVFCTGRGYHLVTAGTYSSKSSEAGSKCKRKPSQNSCEMCLMNNTHPNTGDCHDSRRNEKTAVHAKRDFKDAVDGHSTDCKVKATHRELANENWKSNKKKRVQRSKSFDDAKRSSIVDRMSNSLFWRCGRSGSRAMSKRKGSLSPTREVPSDSEQQHLSESEAARSLCEEHAVLQAEVGTTRSCEHTELVKCSSTTYRCNHESISPITCSFCRERNSIVQLGIPDVVPEKHRRTKSEINTDDKPSRDGYSKFCHEPLLYSRALRTQKDVGVSCNLDLSSDTEICGRRRLTRHESLIRKKHSSLSFPVSYRGDFFRETVPPSQQIDQDYRQNIPQSPQYSPRFYASNTRKGGDHVRVRRSMSSVSERTSNYLHSCYFAPNVRVGSVIAGHLTELDRNRKYRSIPSEDERSLLSSENSVSREECFRGSDFDHPSPGNPRFMERIDHVKPDVQEEMEEIPPNFDQETKAAVEVAKRLAKLNVKMTRDEWRDYFAHQILPATVEGILQQSDSTRDSYILRPDDRTYFENTSSSLETVIDVQQRKAKRSSHAIAYLDLKSDCPPDQVTNCSKTIDTFQNHAQSNMKMGNYTEGFRLGRKTVTASPCLNERQSNSLITRGRMGVHKITALHDNSTLLYYTCERGHKHVPLCDHHSKIENLSDNASMTEDSGFHSARGSYSAWDGSRMARGTFV